MKPPRCPCCGTPAAQRCPNPQCGATIKRVDGRVEEARIDGRLAYTRRSNTGRLTECPGPQRAVIHTNTVSRYTHSDLLDIFTPGGSDETAVKARGAAA